MKIPSGAFEREMFYYEVIDACFHSQQLRRGQYELMKHYFLHGSPPEEVTTPYNKIFPHIDTLTAFMFSADTTRFGCHLPRSVHESEWDKVPAANATLNEEWKDSNGDMVFGQTLTWALVYNTALVKVNVREGRPNPYMVEPECFGVYREDLNYLDRQEAMAHRYYITRSQLEAELVAHPQQAQILARLAEKPTLTDDGWPDVLRRIAVTNTLGSPPISPGGTIHGVSQYANDGKLDYRAKVAADKIEMVELWVWDDDLDDYRVVTMAEGLATIYDRQNFFLPTMKDGDGKILQKGEHPFVQVCPNPMNGYFWGVSEVARLIGLQQFRNERIGQIRDLLAKQVNPPTALFGMFGAVDEMDFALNKAGGVLPSQDPMGKIERHKPEIPGDLWQEIHMIDEMFAESSGLQNLLMGKGESGVRSGRQTSELARLGSSRIKKRALTVEDSLGALATKYFKVMRKYGADRLMTVPAEGKGGPVPFVLSQMPHDTQIEVDAHSNSPLFVEDQKNLAADLFKAKAIDRATLIEMVDPPMKAVMLRNLKKIEAKEAAAAAQQAQQQAQGGSGQKK